MLAVAALLLANLPGVSMARAAGDVVYHWVPDAGGSYGVQFKIGYTFGTHSGKALSGEGRVIWATTDLASLKKSELRVPIGALRTGNPEMECHLREALGLDYKHSPYPGEHVCKNDQLPLSGPGAVVFPEIVLQLEKAKKIDPSHYTVEGVWKIHGVTRPTAIPVEVELKGGRLIVTAKPTLSLKEFGVEVKNFLFISTEDTLKLDLAIQLERAPTS